MRHLLIIIPSLLLCASCIQRNSGAKSTTTSIQTVGVSVTEPNQVQTESENPAPPVEERQDMFTLPAHGERIELPRDERDLNEIYVDSDLPITIDTTANGFRIHYRVQSNDYMVVQTHRYENRTVNVGYEDKSLFLSVYYDGKPIVDEREITKTDFLEAIPLDRIMNYELMRVRLSAIRDEEVQMELSICQPDTDDLYPIDLFISKDGVMRWRVVELIWDE